MFSERFSFETWNLSLLSLTISSLLPISYVGLRAPGFEAREPNDPRPVLHLV
jgi:hypothetical protein